MTRTSAALTFLGIDTGATASHWALAGDDATLLAEGEGPPLQAAELGSARAAQHLRGMVHAIFAQLALPLPPALTVAGMAGAGDSASRLAIAAHLCDLAAMRIVGDPEVAAAAALADGPGLAAWAGTGSFVLARDAAGRLHRAGGRGFLLGDQGSGYDLVRRAAAAAMDAFDEVGPVTALGEALVAAFDAPSRERLGAVMQRAAPREIAARLPAVLEVADRGDAVARGVLHAGGERLAELVWALARRTQLHDRNVMLTFGGGVLSAAALVRAGLEDRLAELGASATLRECPHSAAAGAAFLARAMHRGEPPLCEWAG